MKSSGEYLIRKRTGKAIHDYKMISDKDRVLVGVSGIDSLSLLNVLHERSKYVPVKYKLIAFHAILNKKNARTIEKFVKAKNIEYHSAVLDLKENRKKDIKKTECFWCSWKRRETVFKAANRFKCNKIAFAHHLDDILETFLMNIFFRGELSTMPPKLRMFKGRFHLIRPFAYLEKSDIKKYAREKGIPDMPYRCRHSPKTKRPAMRKILNDLKKNSPRVKENLFKSMSNLKKEYLPSKGIR